MATIDDPQLMIRLLHFLAAPAAPVHGMHSHAGAHGHRMSEGQAAPDFVNFLDNPPESLEISLSCNDAPHMEPRLANPVDPATKPRTEQPAASTVKAATVRVSAIGLEKGWTGGAPEQFVPCKAEGMLATPAPAEPSGITKIRQSCPPFLVRNNAFSVYANQCGDGASSADTLRINIYIPFAHSAREREMPMEICVLNRATVRETIGYILYQYTALGRQPPVKEQVTAYELRMTEDNGEPDVDLPPLDLTQRIAKFEFDSLCLCQVKHFVEVPAAPELRFLRIFYEGQSSIISRTDKKCGATIGEVLNEISRRRVLRQNVDYVIELENEPGVALAPDTTLASLDARLNDPRTIYLRILRKFHKRRQPGCEPASVSGPEFESNLRLFSPQTFSVVRPQRFGDGVAIDLCIDRDRIAMRPFGRGGPFSRTRPVVINVSQIVRCELPDERALLRLHANMEDGEKVYELEATSVDEASKIWSKIDAIMTSRATHSA